MLCCDVCVIGSWQGVFGGVWLGHGNTGKALTSDQPAAGQIKLPLIYFGVINTPMTDKPKLSLVVDSMKLDVDGMSESDGILSVPLTLAREMVLDYGGVKILKPSAELEAAAKFADGLPVTREHPEAGIVTDRAQVLGFMRNPLFENDELKGVLEIADVDLIADVKSGKVKEVSGGFFCNIDMTPGVLGDSKYEAVQKDIFMNHVAIVDQGRCSIEDGCGLNLDSKDVDAPPVDDGAEALDRVTAERDALQGELEALVKVERDAIVADLLRLQDTKKEADLAELKLDALKKELEMVRELRSDRLTLKQDASMVSVDDAYSKIGRN